MSETTQRYLTPGAKAIVLARWAQTQRENTQGRIGDVDPDIVPWCDAINVLQGVCTLQSCAGHRRQPDWIESAGFWLWLDEPMSRAFDALAFELATHPLMKQVTRRYRPYGQEVVDIEACGNGDGHGALGASMGVLLRFLRKLTTQCQAVKEQGCLMTAASI
jgi:hypothetical protein